ncbi:SMI1/KNR4 family protein [Stutzerimonas stutzeri]
MQPATIKNSFESIHTWLSNYAPKILSSLQGPAEKNKLSELEALAGEQLPSGLVELYSIHNGISPDVLANLFFGLPFIPLENTISQIKSYEMPIDGTALKHADSGIKSSFTFSHKRIPIADDSGTCIICIDLDPDPEGIKGQIILIDSDYSVAIKLANSIEELVAKFSEDLALGKYSLQEDALADGNEWLKPDRAIDPGNWFNSPTWAYIKI